MLLFAIALAVLTHQTIDDDSFEPMLQFSRRISNYSICVGY